MYCQDVSCSNLAPCAEHGTSYKLSYFNVRGFAEPIRYLFVIGGRPFEDFRYPVEFVNGFKADEWEADKKSGKFAFALNQIPVLETPKFQLGQSRAIQRYLARDFGLNGSNEIEAAQIDAFCEHVRDLAQQRGDAVRKVERKDSGAAGTVWVNEQLPLWLPELEAAISGPDGYVVGNRTSVADIVLFFTFADIFIDDLAAVTKQLESTPKIAAIVKRIGELPEIVSYRNSRPQTPF